MSETSPPSSSVGRRRLARERAVEMAIDSFRGIGGPTSSEALVHRADAIDKYILNGSSDDAQV